MSLFSSTSTAPPESFFGYVGVFFAVGVASWAMLLSFLSSSISFTANSQPCEKNSFLWINKFFKSHTLTGSCNYRVGFHTTNFSQFDSKVFNTSDLNKNIYSPISLLLLFSGPTAVSRFVISIVVDSINGRIRRSFAHVFNEIEKSISAVFPSFANCDSSLSIHFPSIFRLVVAAFNHRSPNCVQRMSRFTLHSRPLS